MRKIIYGGLIGIILVGSALLVERSIRSGGSPALQPAQSGQSLPSDAKVRELSSKKEIPLTSFKGKVVLINFWASWCQACMAEMPSIVKLYSTFKSKGLEIIAVNVDENPEEVVPGLVQKLGINFPVYTDIDGALAKDFDVVAIPFTVLASRKSEILWSESGERDWASDSVMHEVQKILEQ